MSAARVLITGGAGFIGTNLTARSIEQGHEVVVLDSLARSGSDANARWLQQTYPSRFELIVGDVCDRSVLERTLHGVDHVVHLAAQVAVTTSLVEPLADFDVNARGTLNLLEAIRASPQPPSLVFTSTNKVYGGLDDIDLEAHGTRYVPVDPRVRDRGIDETRALDFHSPYGCSKGAADQYVIDYARSFGLRTVVLRMSCIYGPHQNGNEDQGWVAHFARHALTDRNMTIFGNGKQVRDVLFIDDLLNAFELAWRHIGTVSGRAFNIGGGPRNTLSLLELVEHLEAAAPDHLDVAFADWRVGDQRYYVSDTERFARATGWHAATAPEQGLATLREWLAAPALLRVRGQHQAAVLAAPGHIELRNGAIPEPGAGEVRVRLQGCGICASSLPVWEGRPWFKYPLEPGTPGHEGWGLIDALGDGVDGLHVGDRVAFISNHAFAHFDVAPRAAVVKLPRALNDRPFPGEPIGCAMNIFERSDIRAGMSVAIVGGGFLGALLTQLATDAGADVTVLSFRDYSLQVARAAGAMHVFSTSDPYAAKTRALEICGGRGFERVIEAAGVQSTLDLASALTAERARLVVAGYHQDGLRQVNLQEWNWRGIDVINAHERAIERYAAGIHAAAQAVIEGRIDPFPLLTHALPLAALARGFELTRTRPDGFVKAIVTMEVAS